MIVASVGREHVPCEKLERGGRKTTLNATRAEAQRSGWWGELGAALGLGLPAPGLPQAEQLTEAARSSWWWPAAAPQARGQMGSGRKAEHNRQGDERKTNRCGF